MPRLKVFKAHMGFFDSVVAAPSQKAALEAWGTRQDLFHEGLAEVTDEPAALEALDRPGVVLRRAAGSGDAYKEDAAPPSAPAVRPRKAAVKPARTNAKPRPPPPDRSALTAAEQALSQAERAHEEQAEALERQKQALEAKIRELEDVFAARRRVLQRSVEKARKAYERAGGRP